MIEISKFQVDDALRRMKAGERIVTNELVLGAMIDMHPDDDALNDMASCRNRRQIGTLDSLVAWIGDNKPDDLEYLDAGTAVGSK